MLFWAMPCRSLHDVGVMGRSKAEVGRTVSGEGSIDQAVEWSRGWLLRLHSRSLTVGQTRDRVLVDAAKVSSLV